MKFSQKLLIGTVFTILFLNIFSTIFFLYLIDARTAELTGHASSGTVKMCINMPPTLNVPCNTNMSQNSSYYCQLNGTDPNGNNLTFTQVMEGMKVFNLSADGIIDFTPTNDHVGNWSTVFVLDDGQNCSNSVVNKTFNFSVANINDPPYLVNNLPDINLTGNATYHAFYLNDYFSDPDGDPLTFNVTIPALGISLVLSGSSEVVVTASQCINETTVQFEAKDPYNLTADSNLVTIRVSCRDENEDDQGEDQDSSSGAGGGGGAAVICKEDWNCMDWLTCLPTGYQWRHCYDLGGCNDPKFLKRECDYQGPAPTCEENWVCEDWGACLPNGTQYRTCEDINDCDSLAYMPFLSQPCFYEPNCFDGIQNGNETGVDCGGECGECPIIETPAFIQENKVAAWVIAVSILSAILLLGLAQLYHEQLLKGISHLILILTKKHRKEILLTEVQKQMLLEAIYDAETNKIDKPAHLLYESLTKIVRDYFVMILNLPNEFSKEDLLKGLANKKISKELSSLLINFFDRIYDLEATNTEFDKLFFFSISEELRTLVCATSEYVVKDIERELVEFLPSEEDSFSVEIVKRMISLFRALQYEQYEIAKQEYDTIIGLYEDLPAEEKEAAYDLLMTLFGELKYDIERAKT